MQGLLLLFFSKLDHVPFIRDIQATYTRTGIFGYWVITKIQKCHDIVMIKYNFVRKQDVNM